MADPLDSSLGYGGPERTNRAGRRAPPPRPAGRTTPIPHDPLGGPSMPASNPNPKPPPDRFGGYSGPSGSTWMPDRGDITELDQHLEEVAKRVEQAYNYFKEIFEDPETANKAFNNFLGKVDPDDLKAVLPKLGMAESASPSDWQNQPKTQGPPDPLGGFRGPHPPPSPPPPSPPRQAYPTSDLGVMTASDYRGRGWHAGRPATGGQSPLPNVYAPTPWMDDPAWMDGPPNGGGGGGGGGGGDDKSSNWWRKIHGLPGPSKYNMQPADFGTIGGALSGNPKDIAKLFTNVVEGVRDGLKDMQEGFSKYTAGTFSKERFGDVGSSAFRGVEQSMHGARGIFGQYNPYLIALEKSAGFAATLFESVESLRKFNDQLINSNVAFAEHSAAMTQVEVSMERFKIEMDQVRGARRSQTALTHAESVQRLERSFAKWEDAWANLKGGILSAVNDNLASILEAINKWAGFNADSQNLAEGLAKEAMDAANEIEWIKEFGRLPAGQNSHPRTPRV